MGGQVQRKTRRGSSSWGQQQRGPPAETSRIRLRQGGHQDPVQGCGASQLENSGAPKTAEDRAVHGDKGTWLDQLSESHTE